jgi:hypothetical protein
MSSTIGTVRSALAGVRVDQHQLGDLDLAGQPGDPVDQFRGVGGPAADNR